MNKFQNRRNKNAYHKPTAPLIRVGTVGLIRLRLTLAGGMWKAAALTLANRLIGWFIPTASKEKIVRDPHMALRVAPDLRKEFIRICEANKSNASAEIRAFMQTYIATKKGEPQKADA